MRIPQTTKTYSPDSAYILATHTVLHTGNPLRLSHARVLLRAIFVEDASNAAAGDGAAAAAAADTAAGMPGVMVGGGAFSMLSGSSTASTVLDQARAPLLTVLETKVTCLGTALWLFLR